MLEKAPLMSREAMMRSTESMCVMVSWRKMAACGGLARDSSPEAGGYVGV